MLLLYQNGILIKQFSRQVLAAIGSLLPYPFAEELLFIDLNFLSEMKEYEDLCKAARIRRAIVFDNR
jgi:hypothetical protein